MSSEPSSVEIRFADEFERQLKVLAKRYRRIRLDLHHLIGQLQLGRTPGNRIQGVGADAFKVRVKNSDIQKGKSGGYRIIYLVASPTCVILLTIYSKSDQGEISAARIQKILAEFEQQTDE